MAEIQNRQQAITNLQRYLRRLSFEGSDYKTVPIDGIFDSATRDALIEFQRANGLEPSGIADKLTWDTLYEEYLRAEGNAEREYLNFFPDLPTSYAVREGESLLLVSIIQLLLMELSVTYDVFEDVVQSGVYDERTVEAIKKFQRISGLDVTGEIDRATYNRIVREYSALERIKH